MHKVHIALIAAVSQNGVIGNHGKIPWNLPEDRKLFARLTAGHMTVMGRKTWESLPEKFRPLPGRKNVVLSQKSRLETTGALVCRSWEEALSVIKEERKIVFVIGGEALYRKALPYAKTLHITLVNAWYDGDAHFPKEDMLASEWHPTSITPLQQTGETECFHQVYKRVSVRGNFVNISHSRSDDQTALMEQIETARVCPFCPEHILTYHERPILRDGKWWIVTENRKPYEGSRLHLMFIYKRHVRMPYEVNAEGQEELLSHVKWATNKYSISGGTLLWRFGDTTFTGASVDHLHAHLVAGSGDPEKKIRARIG